MAKIIDVDQVEELPGIRYHGTDYVIDPRFSGYAREQLERFCEILRGKIETVEIRGVD